MEVAYTSSWGPDDVEVHFTDGSSVDLKRSQHEAIIASGAARDPAQSPNL